MGALMGGAAALGPALGGLILTRANWRVLFLVNLPLTLLSWWLQPRGFAAGVTTRPRGHAFDWVGSLLLGGALVLAVLSTRLSATMAWPAALGGLAFFVALLLQARTVAAPVVDFSLFRETPFVAGALVIALQNLAMYALLVQVPFLFGGSGGSSRFSVVVIAMTAMMAMASPVGGRLAERIGSRVTVLVGALAGAIGVLSLVPLSSMARTATGVSAGQVAVPLLMVGLGLGLSTGPSQAAALSAIDPHRSGMASAAVSTLRYLGAIVGTAILGLALGGGGETLAGQQRALWTFGAAFLLSAVAALKLRQPAASGGRSR
jgi:MFS family permease